MRIKHDGEGDTLDILVKDGQIHRAEECGQIAVNCDENNTVVEVEILNASKSLGDSLSGIIKAKPKGESVEIGL